MTLSEAFTRMRSGALPRKRLNRAIDHVLKLWIPINTDILAKIQSKIASGYYKSNHSAFIQDLKEDVSLYAWCLRKLCEMTDGNADYDPIRHLESIEQDELAMLLDIDPSEISSHSLESTDSDTARILKEVLLGASCAQVLSEKKGINQDRAYGSALLRQLGLTLIAWNYSSVFKNAIEQAKEGKELDVAISEQLGFSPALFAIQLVQRWGLSERKCYSFGLIIQPGTDAPAPLGEEATEEAERFERAEMLREVCEIGEKLARANDPENYPGMKGAWEDIESQIESALGKHGLARIRENFEENSVAYAECLPVMTNSEGIIFDEVKYPPSPELKEAFKKNRFIGGCSPNIQTQLKRLYRDIASHSQVERENLRKLIHETIPSAGFNAGCVFTMDPMMAKLVPQLKIKEIQGIEAKAYDCTMATTHADIIGSAFQSQDPLTCIHDIPPDGPGIFAIAGTFGKRRRFGVLYLEMPESKSQQRSEEETLNHFHAIAKALNDCLQL